MSSIGLHPYCTCRRSRSSEAKKCIHSLYFRDSSLSNALYSLLKYFGIIKWCKPFAVLMLLTDADLAKYLHNLVPPIFMRPEHGATSICASHVSNERVGNDILLELGMLLSSIRFHSSEV